VHFKLDENIPARVQAVIEQAGHDASTVYGEKIAGVSDQDLMAICAAERMLLITLDGGFANIMAYPPGMHPGIILLRLPNLSASSVTTAVAELLSAIDPRDLAGATTIVEPGRLRTRR
jgi:predicted nuclease of predicted toxin-antitoxin system